MGQPFTRESDVGRGMFGRADIMGEKAGELKTAMQAGQAKDEAAIGVAKDGAVAWVTGVVEKVGGGLETAAIFDDKVYRGAEKAVKVVVKDGWQVLVGFGEDFKDVMAGTAKAALTGLKWAGIGAAAIAATPFVLAESAALGLVELGQYGAKGLSEARKGAHTLVLTGVRALAAAVDAAALTGQIHEENRIDEVRGQHTARLEAIRQRNLGVQIVRKVQGK